MDLERLGGRARGVRGGAARLLPRQPGPHRHRVRRRLALSAARPGDRRAARRRLHPGLPHPGGRQRPVHAGGGDLAGAGRRRRAAPPPRTAHPLPGTGRPHRGGHRRDLGESLRLERVGVLDNFFELGGNSLLGVTIVAAVRRAFELDELPPHILYEAPTVAALARTAEALASGATPAAADPGGSQVRAQLRRSGLEASAARRRGR
ncbi:phosphopantetheine-binding protein [Nonomuraea recticatena]|uniref:phosphopantetheine-binding protein n=1 Tax=Nonomuraea recticatena TaxID=46178 RepID=UPI00360C02E0